MTRSSRALIARICRTRFPAGMAENQDENSGTTEAMGTDSNASDLTGRVRKLREKVESFSKSFEKVERDVEELRRDQRED